jgi:hypothetical protein
MDKARFQELQYLTLRKEVEDSLNRAFQIMVGGATLIPILVGILGHYTATPILLTLPMMVVVIALLYLNQWNSIMRCGRYIRTRIEPEMMGEEGWEAWLESHPDTHMGAVHNRLVDTYLVFAFYLLTGAYYFATGYIGVTYAHQKYGAAGQWSTLAAYVVIGIGMGYIILERVPTHTTTKKERELPGKATSQAQSQAVASAPISGAKDPAVELALRSNAPGAAVGVPSLNERTPLPPRPRRPRKNSAHS